MATAPCAWPVQYIDCSGAECKAYENWTEGAERDAAIALFEAQAIELLWNWTGGVFGLCEVEVRPCRQDCAGAQSWASTFWGRGPGFDPSFPRAGVGGASTGGFFPVLVSGKWYNMSCGCVGSCRCTIDGSRALALPGPVSSVESIYIDGALVPSSAYRVDHQRLLVRIDGGTWPQCQDMLKPAGPQYEPVTISGPGGSATFTRTDELVTIDVTTSGVPGTFTEAPVPWSEMSFFEHDAAQGAYVTIFGGEVSIVNGPSTLVQNWDTAYTTDSPSNGMDVTDTFQVTYQRGIPVPIGGQVAAGRLACELALAACDSEECGLPERIQTITRQGLTVGVNTSDTAWEQTGIWSIDNWVASVNRPKSFASVRSVDLPSLR